MSLLRDHKDPTGCSFQDHQSKMKNNNKQALFAPDGDANANQIQESDTVTICGSKTVDHGSIPPLLSQRDEQDKVIIWGTHSQCDDPDLEEFEMLECMELEAYLTEGQHGTEKVTEISSGSCLNGKSGPCDSEQDEPRAGKGMDSNGEEEKASPWKVVDHDPTGPQLLGDKGRTVCVTTTESSSENDIFLSCMSTISVIGGSFASGQDSSGEGHALELQHILSEPHKTISEDVSLVSQSLPVVPVKAMSLDKPDPSFPEASSVCVDVNLNSAVLSQECNPLTETGTQETCCSEARALLEECMQHPKDTQSFQVKLHQRNLDGTDEHLNGSTNKQEAALSSIKDCNENVAFCQDPLSSCCSNEEQPKMEPLSDPRTSLHNTSQKVKERLSREEVIFEGNKNQPKAPLGGTASQPSAVEPRALRKQGSFEHGRSTSPSLEKKAALARRPWGSPTRPTTPPSAKPAGSPRRRLPASPVKCTRAVVQERSEAPPGPACHLKTSIKACPSSGILKPVLQHSAKPEEKTEPEGWTRTSPPLSHTQKPKNVRPKIITSVRQSPTAKPHVPEVPYEVSTLPPRLSGHIPNLPNREPKTGGPGRALSSPSATSLLHDKHHPEVQKGCSYSPDLVVSGIRPPSDMTPPRLSGKSESFCEELTDKHLHERGQDASTLESPGYEDSVLSRHRAAGALCSPRALRPQLGLGAVTRLPYARNRMLFTGQRSPLPLPHPARAASPPAHCYQETTGDQRKLSADAPPRSLLPQPGYTGLRLPGYTRLPTARLATFGFVRSASVSSVPSYQSVESSYGDLGRPNHRLSSGSDDPSLQRVSGPPIEAHPQASGRSSPHPPGAPGTTRRSLLPPPRSSPLSTRKEIQKETGAVRPVASSPKRLSTVSPKPQSPVHSRQRPAVAVVGGARVGPPGDSPRRGRPDSERQLVQQLRGRCEEQERQLQGLRAELARATLGLDAFAISTQHFCLKSENAIERQRDLSLELSRIRDEAAFNAARWERLRSDKEELERSFEWELQGLRSQQRAELRALEEGLTAQHAAERDRMCAERKAERDELQAQQQDRIEEMSASREAALSKMENAHLVTLGKLQEQHARTVEELKEAHEQERRLLEQEFEKHRLLLQDQVDTLTFQNRSLRDRAKRFEEALRKSTDEQIVDALAPYQHIKEDLKSLKEVLEMKNQQIHKQELKISELQKMAQKNVVLEERVQVLQQQNEDLKARIDRNLAMSRQLSEENANLQVYVEKESSEKKRLSRTNEELLWRLQTGELSPRMLSPSSSPIHRASPGPGSPARFQPLPR